MSKRIPPYDEKHRLEFERAEQTILAKFAKSYTFPKEPDADKAEAAVRFDDGIRRYLFGDEWRVRAAKYGIKERQCATVDEVMLDVMREYGGAFFLRDELFAANRDADKAVMERQTDIYINHITVKSLSRIGSLGFPPKETLALLGHCIHRSAISFNAIVGGKCSVSPSTKELPQTEAEALELIDKIMGFGASVSAQLSKMRALQREAQQR